MVFPLSTEAVATAARTGDALSVFELLKTFVERHSDVAVGADDVTFSLKGGAAMAASGMVSADTVTIVGAPTSDSFTVTDAADVTYTLSKVPGDRNADGMVTGPVRVGAITTGDVTYNNGTGDRQIREINSITGVVTLTGDTVATGDTVTFTCTPAVVSPGDSLVFTYAAGLCFAEAKASAAWNQKIPRDSGLVLASPAPNGAYDDEDLLVIVDGKTLSSADYTWSIATHLLTITTTSVMLPTFQTPRRLTYPLSTSTLSSTARCQGRPYRRLSAR